ncbi:MAG: hypothetical protein LC798_04885 [Chloroflexi bacterium]|nr:hypothetical protein [Chloroflexota bacterium]
MSVDTEVITLAHQVRAAAVATGVHPVMLALQRIEASCGVHASRGEM